MSTARAPRQGRPRRQRGVRESLGAISLGFETIIIFLAALVAFGLQAVSPPLLALIGGAVLCLLLVVTIPLLSKRIGIVMGWALQVIILASALLVPLMVVVALLFGGIWAYGMIKGGQIDRDNALRAAGS